MYYDENKCRPTFLESVIKV